MRQYIGALMISVVPGFPVVTLRLSGHSIIHMSGRSGGIANKKKFKKKMRSYVRSAYCKSNRLLILLLQLTSGNGNTYFNDGMACSE